MKIVHPKRISVKLPMRKIKPSGRHGHEPTHGPRNAEQEQRIRDRAYQLWKQMELRKEKPNTIGIEPKSSSSAKKREETDLSVEQLNDLA